MLQVTDLSINSDDSEGSYDLLAGIFGRCVQ